MQTPGVLQHGALVVEGGDPDPRAGKKGEILRGDSVPMRVFRSAWPGQQIRFNSSISHGYWDCLTLLPHRVRSGTMRMMNMVE